MPAAGAGPLLQISLFITDPIKKKSSDFYSMPPFKQSKVLFSVNKTMHHLLISILLEIIFKLPQEDKLLDCL